MSQDDDQERQMAKGGYIEVKTDPQTGYVQTTTADGKGNAPRHRRSQDGTRNNGNDKRQWRPNQHG